jgi:hypothetical protein
MFLAVSIGLVPVIGSGSASAADSCAVTWGSLPKAVGTGGSLDELTGLRAGRHECYDRLVIDASGPTAGYSVQYVDEVTMDGSGFPVPLRGGARLLIVDRAPMDPPATPGEAADVTGFSSFRQVAWAGSFEGQTSFGLGVRARLPFRVLALAGPGSGSRLVIDVAHHW